MLIKYYLAKRKQRVIVATVLSAFSALVSMTLLAYLNDLADSGVRGDAARVAMYVLGLVALMFVSNVIAQNYLARYGAATVAELRRTLSERFLRMDYQKMQALGKHVVTGSLIMDVSQLSTLFQVLPLFFFQAMTLLFGLGYLAWLSVKLMLVFVIIMAIAILTSRQMMRKFRVAFMALRNEQDGLYGCFAGLSEGKKELSLNRARRRHFLDHVIQPSIERNRELGYASQKIWSYTGAWSITMTFIMLFSVIYTGSLYFGLDRITVMHAFTICVFLMNPLNFLLIASRDIVQGATSARKLAEIGLSEAEALPSSESIGTKTEWRQIGTRGLSHCYNETDRYAFVFGPIDLSIQRGETVFVIGGNGSGKSTLALLLSGLLRPTGGHLEIDGRPIAEGDIDDYRQLFSGVFFDFHLFRHVIDHGGQLARDELVNDLLRKLDLHAKVQSLNGEFSTLDLSQGQRKRLALVQGYLDDGEIFLFDEWAADQDPEFKQFFYLQLIPELKRRGKTVIAITHDEKYFDCADRLIKLEQGRLVPQAPQITLPEPAEV